MTTVNGFSPMGLRDNEDNSGFGLSLQFAFQVKLTVNQNEGLLPTNESQSFQSGCQVPKMVLEGFLLSQLHPLDSFSDDGIFVLGFKPVDNVHFFLQDSGSRYPYPFLLLTLSAHEDCQLNPI